MKYFWQSLGWGIAGMLILWTGLLLAFLIIVGIISFAMWRDIFTQIAPYIDLSHLYMRLFIMGTYPACCVAGYFIATCDEREERKRNKLNGVKISKSDPFGEENWFD